MIESIDQPCPKAALFELKESLEKASWSEFMEDLQTAPFGLIGITADNGRAILR